MDIPTITFPILGEGFVIQFPNYISIFGFNLYLYGLFITAGFALAAIYLYKRRNMLELSKEHILDLVILAVPFGLIGARLFYVIFNPELYFGSGNWLNIIMLREGGLAVYGGVIGGGIAFYVYSRVKKVPIGKLLDAAGFGLLIGQAVGRWGNFFNREAYGVETNLPWRMGLTAAFESEAYWLTDTPPAIRTIYVHPTFLYESLWNAVGFVMLHVLSKKYKPKYNGQFFLLYVAWYGLGRFLIEGLRTDSLFIYGTGVRISQLLAGLSCFAAVAIMVLNYFRVKDELAESAALAENAQSKETDSTAETSENSKDEGSSKSKINSDPAKLSKDAPDDAEKDIIVKKNKTKDTKSKTEDTKSKTKDTKNKTEDTKNKTKDTKNKTKDTKNKTKDKKNKTKDKKNKTKDTKNKTKGKKKKTK